MRITAVCLLVFLSPAVLLATISGTILTEQGEPFAGATITAYRAETSREFRQRLLSAATEREPVARVSSGPDGSFQLDSKNIIAVDLTITGPGRAPLEIPAVAGLDVGVQILRPTIDWILKVTGDGRPVAGARILIGRQRVLKTNTAGEAIAPGSFGEITVIHPDFAIGHPDPSLNEQELVLRRGVEIRGRVLSGETPVAGATVSVGGWPVATSGSDGGFFIAHAPESWSVITANTADRVAEWRRSQRGQIDLRLGSAVTIDGMVRDTVTGSALPGARVFAFAPDGLEESVLTDPRGSFRFDRLPTRSYALGGSHPGFSINAAEVVKTSGTTLEARPFAQISGRVADENRRPVAGVLVSTNLPPPRVDTAGRHQGMTFTDKDGRFSLRFAPNGKTLPRVFARKEEFMTASTSAPALKPGGRLANFAVTISKGFPLEVKIVDAKRQPVPGAQVRMVRVDDPTYIVACDGPENCNATDEEGVFPVRISEGAFDINVVALGAIDKHLPAVKLNAHSSPLEIQLDEGVDVSGRVINGDGTPAIGARIETVGSPTPQSATAAADGKFVIRRVASGRLSLVAGSADHHLHSEQVDVTAPAANVTITLPKGGRIEGRVVDRATRMPVQDFSFLVRLHSFSGFTPQNIHAADGSFAIDGVPPGSLDIQVGATGYVEALQSGIQVSDGRTTSGVEIQLDRGARVSGHVTAGGRPVAGVLVHASGAHAAGVGDAMTTSDAEGGYTLDGIPTGEQSLEFRKPGFVPQTKNIEIAEGEEANLDVVLDRGRLIRGRVVSASGQPVGGALVTLSRETSAEPRREAARTDGEGMFVLDGVGEAHYTVTARKEGFRDASRSDVDPARGEPITLTLETGGSITGRILGIPAADLANTTVYAQAPHVSVKAHPDAAGAFTLSGLPDGQVSVVARTMPPSTERTSSAKILTVEHGLSPPMEIDFSGGITLRGRVTVGGVPLASGMLNYLPEHSDGPGAGHGVLSPGGLYEIAGLRNSAYKMSVSGTTPSGAQVSYQTMYTVTGSTTFDIDIRGATFSGRVVDAKTNAPLPGAEVDVLGGQISTATSNSDGRFEIPAVQDGRYEVRAGREPYAPFRQELVVSGGSIPEIVIRMEGGRAVTVHVVDAKSGRPIDSVVMINRDGHQVGTGLPQTGEGVRFTLAPGVYEAQGTADGYAVGKVPFTIPGPDPRVALVRSAHLVVRSSAGGQVRVLVPGAQWPAWNTVLSPGAETRVSLAPGSYVLELRGPQGGEVLKSVTVKLVSEETTIANL